MRRDLLNEALLGLRESDDGEGEDVGSAGAAAETRDRLLHTLERKRRNHHAATLIVAVVVVSLCASTSWAAISGRLPDVVYELLETVRGSSTRDTGAVVDTTPESPVVESSHRHGIGSAESVVAPPDESEAADEGEVEDEGEVAIALERHRERSSRPSPTNPSTTLIDAVRSPATTELQPVEAPEIRPVQDAQAMYQVAHQAHFVRRDYSAALAAWDRYLAVAPGGRFGLEARYNRAIALVRLGRRQSAMAALRPFADGVHGGYRQGEARRLIEALQQFTRPDGS